MTRIGARIWYWSLPILPFTAIATFILTLIVCSEVLLRNSSLPVKLPNISILGTGPAYYYFVTGFVILTPQFLLILIGRLKFLSRSQSIIDRSVLYPLHGVAFIASIFLLTMAIVSLDDNSHLHVSSAFGMFGFLALYCLLHTIVVIYLFVQRSKAPQHSNILWPLWFLICSILLIIFAGIWMTTAQSIPQYIAATMPFLYILGFVPQFWRQAKMKNQDDVLSTQAHESNEMS